MVRRIDFYNGALLSVLISKNIVPMLVEATDNTRIYKLMTNKDKHVIYTKYLSNPNSGNKDFLWSFVFTDNEVNKIENLNRKYEEKFKLVLICGKDFKNDTEFAVLNGDEINKCIDLKKIIFSDNQRISVKKIYKSKNLNIYGEKINSNQSIKVSRKRLLDF